MATDGDSHFSLSRKSHVRYPTRYPQLRNAEETAEYQQNAGIPLAPQSGFSEQSGSPFFIPASASQFLHPLKDHYERPFQAGLASPLETALDY